jgi:hypothetical protein
MFIVDFTTSNVAPDLLKYNPVFCVPPVISTFKTEALVVEGIGTTTTVLAGVEAVRLSFPSRSIA